MLYVNFQVAGGWPIGGSRPCRKIGLACVVDDQIDYGPVEYQFREIHSFVQKRPPLYADFHVRKARERSDRVVLSSPNRYIVQRHAERNPANPEIPDGDSRTAGLLAGINHFGQYITMQKCIVLNQVGCTYDKHNQ